MNTIKTLIVLILFAWTTVQASAQVSEPTYNVDYWVFIGFDQWYETGDTIFGKKNYELRWYFTLSDDYPITINGKTYMRIGHWPFAYNRPSGTQRAKYEERPEWRKKRDYFSIVLRREGGRVYTNREDYLYYQRVHLFLDLYGSNDGSLFSFGNPDYLPYHLTADSTELILYDYNMEVGDSYRHVDGYEDISVVKKDVVAYNDGLSRRRLTLSNGLILVEGIGCINSNGMLIDYLNPELQYEGNYTYLKRCTNGHQNVYDYESAGLHIVEWDASGISQTLDGQKTATKGMSDLQGRRLTGQPRRGLYIRDGRKYLAR